MQPVRRREFRPTESPVSSQAVNPSPYAPPYQQQPSQGTSSSSRTRILLSEPHQQLSSTSSSRGRSETKPQPIRRLKGQPPETPVSPVNPSSPPYQPPSQGISSSSQTLFSGPQRQPSSTSTSRGGNESNPQPTRRLKGQSLQIHTHNMFTLSTAAAFSRNCSLFIISFTAFISTTRSQRMLRDSEWFKLYCT